MKVIAINLKTSDKRTFRAGVIGEHNATELLIQLPPLAENIYHKIIFSNGFFTDNLYDTEGELRYQLPSKATTQKNVNATIESYEGESRIYKSPLLTFLFEESTSVPEPPPEVQESFRQEFAALSADTKAAADEARQAAADIGDSVTKAEQASREASQAVDDANTAVINAETAVQNAATATAKATAAAQTAEHASQEIPKTINTALEEAKQSGAFKGEKGDTPQKGIDYATVEEIRGLVNEIMKKLPGEGNIIESQTTFFDATPTMNLLNAYDTENKKNSQINPNGTIATNPSWYSTVSHKMSVKDMPKDYYRTNQNSKVRIAEYDVNNNFLEIKEISDMKFINLNENTDYVRMEFFGSASKIVFGRSVAPITTYVPFGFEYELKKKYVDSYLPKIPLITTPVVASKASLLNGEKLSTADVPQIKANYILSFRARINKFESIKISNDGEAVYSASALEINNTNFIIKRYDNVQETVPHGLTIGGYIDVVISARDDFKADIAVSTKSGTAQKTMFWNGSGGKIWVKSYDSELTDCYLSWYSQDLFKPIWAFGDSFFDGWPHMLTAMGFKNFMIDAVSGRAALGAWNSLQKAMKFNTPEKILWCMGMNDGEKGSMNQGWYSRYLDVAKYCDQNNIELILTTIPTNRNSSHEIKNKFIREESGRRYVDIAKAVGADISPEWYAGLLSSDGTHPTQKGYAVIANRVATDVPELKEI